ncbi:MAG: hypothetical protein Q9227_001323 [Pyrenula ochraceoflavens]
MTERRQHGASDYSLMYRRRPTTVKDSNSTDYLSSLPQTPRTPLDDLLDAEVAKARHFSRVSDGSSDKTHSFSAGSTPYPVGEDDRHLNPYPDLDSGIGPSISHDQISMSLTTDGQDQPGSSSRSDKPNSLSPDQSPYTKYNSNAQSSSSEIPATSIGNCLSHLSKPLITQRRNCGNNPNSSPSFSSSSPSNSNSGTTPSSSSEVGRSSPHPTLPFPWLSPFTLRYSALLFAVAIAGFLSASLAESTASYFDHTLGSALSRHISWFLWPLYFSVFLHLPPTSYLLQLHLDPGYSIHQHITPNSTYSRLLPSLPDLLCALIGPIMLYVLIYELSVSLSINTGTTSLIVDGILGLILCITIILLEQSHRLNICIAYVDAIAASIISFLYYALYNYHSFDFHQTSGRVSWFLALGFFTAMVLLKPHRFNAYMLYINAVIFSVICRHLLVALALSFFIDRIVQSYMHGHRQQMLRIALGGIWSITAIWFHPWQWWDTLSIWSDRLLPGLFICWLSSHYVQRRSLQVLVVVLTAIIVAALEYTYWPFWQSGGYYDYEYDGGV